MAVIRTSFFFSRVHGMLGSLLYCCFSITLFHPQTCLALGEHTDFLKVQCVSNGAHFYAICFLKTYWVGSGIASLAYTVHVIEFILNCFVPLPTIACCFSLLSVTITTACFTDWTELPMKRFWEISFHGAVCRLSSS
jgi:hypothetical protein